MRQKYEELTKKYTDTVFLENFKSLFSLRILFLQSIIQENYTVPNNIGNAIVLTDHGQSYFERLKGGRFREVPDHILKFALLMEFYHEELFVDINKCNVAEIESLLNTQILDGSLKYPWVYGRLLYDKYFNDFENQEDLLKHFDVLKLLDSTPIGVFQVGHYVIGSLGLTKSNVTRFLPPQRTIKLWHCPDRACNRFHSVHLCSGESVIPQVLSELDDLLRDQIPSEWPEIYFELIENKDFHYDYHRISETPYLLINSLGDSEIKSLLKEIIDSDSGFRSRMPKKKQFSGASDEIVKGIPKDVCFQLVLLSSDETNVKALEKLIDDGVIFIPPTEVRRPVSRVAKGYYRIHHECNQLGLRSVSTSSNLCLRLMHNLLIKIYSEPNLQQQLEWKIRHHEGSSFKEKLDAYIISEEPKKIIRETILAGPIQIARTFEYLVGNFNMPRDLAQEDKLVDKILWKLGFDINIYPNQMQKFWERIRIFKETTSCCTEFNDSAKERIRSSAVNFWISLEEILEHTLSYITWALLSDHFFTTEFKYNFEEARDLMCVKLHGRVIGSSEPLAFDNKGKNTLYPLTQGFLALCDICDELLERGAVNFRRSDDRMPSFWHKTDLVTFPFESTLLLFDLKPNDYVTLKGILSEVPQIFSKANVLSVRNRTQHKRDDFPTQEEILNACFAVESVVNKLEINGVFPNVYQFKSNTTDKFNRSIREFEDYNGRIISLKPTFEFSGSKLPETRSPQIFTTVLKIGKSNEYLRFKYQESSSYLKYWKNFPLRKDQPTDKNNELEK